MLIAGEIGAVVLCASTWAETSSDERSATAPWSWPSGGIQSIVPRNFEYEVVDTGESVTVGFDEQPRPPAPEDEDIACNASVESQRVEVQLDAPLGDREVYDGVQPEPRPVDRAVETVDVTVVPDGWTAVGMAIAGVEDDTWEQAFGKEGADWYFVVSQQPEADAITPGGTPTPVTVHGIEGLTRRRAHQPCDHRATAAQISRSVGTLARGASALITTSSTTRRNDEASSSMDSTTATS